MNSRLVDLYLQQGRLLERIAVQRADLRRQLAPIARSAQRADAALTVLQQSIQTLRRHPLTVAAALTLVILLKPRRAWAWGVRGLWLWRQWQRLQPWLPLRRLWR